MCLRKLQRWPESAYIAEFSRIAVSASGAPGLVAQHLLRFVRGFKPELTVGQLSTVPEWLAPLADERNGKEAVGVEDGASGHTGLTWKSRLDSIFRPDAPRGLDMLAKSRGDMKKPERGESQLMHALALEGLTMVSRSSGERLVRGGGRVKNVF